MPCPHYDIRIVQCSENESAVAAVEQYADLLRDYYREFFVSKGMVADFAIHDKGDGNPHAHILLTMRAMDEKGKFLPKSRKVYDLDENGKKSGFRPDAGKSTRRTPCSFYHFQLIIHTPYKSIV